MSACKILVFEFMPFYNWGDACHKKVIQNKRMKTAGNESMLRIK